MTDRLRVPVAIIAIFICVAAACGISCTGSTSTSTTRTELISTVTAPDESFDWSAVTPDLLWDTVGQLYQDEGPLHALVLLDKGVTYNVVTSIEADQTRAGFLYELGRLDEAFIALVNYRIDESRPDLLRLRADVVWTMGRYEDALRDYLAVYNNLQDEPESEFVYALARLYSDLGDWESAGEMVAMLDAREGDMYSILYHLIEAIKGTNGDEIDQWLDRWKAIPGNEGDDNAISTLAEVYLLYLDSEYQAAIDRAVDYISSYGYNHNIASMILKMDVELTDFEQFELDIRWMLDILGGITWLDSPPDVFPGPVDDPLAVASLLDAMSALELGWGLRAEARLHAERALDLYPYDHVALLQLAAIEITERDLYDGFNYIKRALDLAPPADVRTRYRALMFSQLGSPAGLDGEPIDIAYIEPELESLLGEMTSRYPENSYYRFVEAELEGYRGNYEAALEIITDACGMAVPGREMFFRYAYYFARNGMYEEAEETLTTYIPAGGPYLTWATVLQQEAEYLGDESLLNYSYSVRSYIDPGNLHPDFFEPVAEEQ